MAGATAEQAQAGLDAWMARAGKAGDAVVDLGSPLAGMAHIGPASPAYGAQQVAGFSILQAESADALSGLQHVHPHVQLAGGSVWVLEFLPIAGV